MKQGKTGFVFPEHDHSALTDILIRLLSNPELRKQIGMEATREIARWNYDMAVSNFLASVRTATLRSNQICTTQNGSGPDPN